MALSPTLLRIGFTSLALALQGCADDPRFAPLGGDAESFAPLGNEGGVAVRYAQGASPSREGDATLAVATTTAVRSYLSGLRAVVTNARGQVVAGAESDAEGGDARAGAAPDLLLTVPSGEGYSLTVSAATTDAEPTACRAVVGPLRLEADAAASVQILAWDCGGPTGYVPQGVASECFWLAEWLFVGRARAALGEDIDVRAAGHDAQGNPARFDWSVPPPSLGRFAAPSADRTSFRCQSPGKAQPLKVTISDAECRAELSREVDCF